MRERERERERERGGERERERGGLFVYQQITLFEVRDNDDDNNNNNNNNEITFNSWSIDLRYPNFVTRLFEPFTK